MSDAVDREEVVTLVRAACQLENSNKFALIKVLM